MLMWEYVFAADQKHDLAGPDTGREWLEGVNSWYAKAPPPELQIPKLVGGPVPWPAEVREAWTRGVHALRVLGAARMKGQKLLHPPPPGYDSVVAQAICQHFLWMLRVAANDQGVARLVPHPPHDAELFWEFRWAENPANTVALFFQRVFASMVEFVPSTLPVCSRCMRPLPPTGTGRVSRAELCKSCKFKSWNERNRTEEQRRARWRQDQQAKRTKDRNDKKAAEKNTKKK